MNTKSVITFVLVTVGILIGVVALLWRFSSTPQSAVISDVAGEQRLKKGQGPITIVEFSDFQCPACKAVQQPLDELLKKYDGKVTFVYRYFPLTTIHKNAQLAAQAAESANKQGKFWEMHDVLFDKQGEWEGEKDPTGKFVQYATDLGLDSVKFTADLTNQEVVDAVTNDNLAATRYRLTGTPTFFVNGVQTEFNEIEAKIQEATK
jgi:protein-disulfide isomerase